MISVLASSVVDDTRGGSRGGGGGGGGGGTPGARPPKIGKNMIFWRKIVIFHTKYLKEIFKCAPLTWNPGSSPEIVGDPIGSN
jgi:hypothetical protein